MALTINTNIPSSLAQKQLGKTNDLLAKSMEKMASGKRINRAQDDAALLAISNKLEAMGRSINQAVRNTNDAVSMLQVADAGMEQQGDAVIRMRELAVQAGNGTLSDSGRAHLNDEYQALKAEVSRISETTEFMGTNLLDGSASGGVAFQTGYQNSSDDTVTVQLGDTGAGALGLEAGGSDNLLTQESAQASIGAADNAMASISSQRADVGAMQNRLGYTLSNLQATAENFAAANSRIEDTDYAIETANSIKNQILLNANTSILAQANLQPQQALSLL